MTGVDYTRRALAGFVLVVAALCAAAAPLRAQVWKAHGVPLFVSASHPSGHQGFVRVINRSDEAGEVLIDAVDDEGVPSAVVTLAIGAGETVHFNSGDLEDGNAGKGLSGAIGTGDGNWPGLFKSRHWRGAAGGECRDRGHLALVRGRDALGPGVLAPRQGPRWRDANA